MRRHTLRVLETFTIDTFSGRIGERFRVRFEPDVPVELELVEAQALGPAEGGRAPFSIVFRGLKEPIYAQHIYPIEHDELGSFELFLVPLEPDASGARYEAIFT
jgi:hypothetical protein